MQASLQQDESINVLLTNNDGKGIIVPAERMESRDAIVLSLIPKDPRDVSFLADLRKKPRDFIGVAYKNMACMRM